MGDTPVHCRLQLLTCSCLLSCLTLGPQPTNNKNYISGFNHARSSPYKMGGSFFIFYFFKLHHPPSAHLELLMVALQSDEPNHFSFGRNSGGLYEIVTII